MQPLKGYLHSSWNRYILYSSSYVLWFKSYHTMIVSYPTAFSAAEFCILEWEALQLKIQTLSGFSIPNMILAISSLSSYTLNAPLSCLFWTLETKSQTVRFSYTYRLEPVCTISWSISCDYLSIIQYTARWVLGENLCSRINSCNDHMTIYFNK